MYCANEGAKSVIECVNLFVDYTKTPMNLHKNIHDCQILC